MTTPATRRPRAGQPSKRGEPRVIAAVLRSLAHGATRTAAAAAVGVTQHSLRRWIEADPEFALAVAKAEAQMETSLVDVIYATARAKNREGQPTQASWLAAMTLLERRHPENWARRDRIDISMEIRNEAKRIAEQNGLDPAEVLAEAETVLAEARR